MDVYSVIIRYGTFLRLKIVTNEVLRELWFYFCLGFRHHFFRRTKLEIGWFLKKTFLVLKVSWKNV